MVNPGARSRRTVAGVLLLLSSVAGNVGRAEDATVTPPVLNEVIVTAQKREERLQDVPVPVTAISAGRIPRTRAE